MSNRPNLDAESNEQREQPTPRKYLEFPEEWEMTEIGKVVDECRSGFACSKRYVRETGIPHLRPYNIGYYGKLDLSHLVFLPPEKVDVDIYSLREGDVLFNNTNSKELVGRAAIVDKDIKCGFSNHITRLRINANLLTPRWLTHSINYLWSKGYFLRRSKKWIGQAGMNSDMLMSTKIPRPPKELQERIILRVEEILNETEKLKKVQEETLEDIKRMPEAVLRMAFSGKL